MSEKYKKTYRGYLIDNHAPDAPIVTLEHLNPEEYEQFFKEANINHLMLYCKDHWGNSYYDTKIGKMHNGLKEDWIGKLVPILRKHNIEFNAYYCFEYDQYAPTAHPEWGTVKKDGSPLVCGDGKPDATARWGIPCYETGYRAYIMGQLKEIISQYHPDSLFIDIFGKSLCYCETCQREFEERYGYQLPYKEQDMILHNKELVEFMDKQAEDMLDEVKAQLKEIDPSLAITVNFSAHYPKEIRDKLDYLFTEPWAGNWLSGAYARDTSGGKYPQLGPGDVSQVYNYKEDEIYELAAAEIAAQGCRVFMYSEPMHYDGTLDHTESKKIGKAYRQVEKYEEYLEDREIVADIGIIQSDIADSLIVTHPVVARSVGRALEGGQHRKALLGAMKMCEYSKYTWRVVPELEFTPEKLKKFKMILLPNLFYVTEELKEMLNAYVEEGGCLLISGETGMYDAEGKLQDEFTLGELSGCHLIKKNETYKRNVWSAYVERKEDKIWEYCEPTTPPVWEYTVETLPRGGQVLGTFAYPATELTDTSWVNWGYPLPGKGTDIPAIYRNQKGKGCVYHFCFGFFAMETEKILWGKKLFLGICQQQIQPSVYLETDIRNILEYTCYERNQGKELILHELSRMAALAEGDTVPVEGGTLRLKLPGKSVEEIRMVYPENKKMEFHTEGDEIICPLDALRIHGMYQVIMK